MSPQWRASPRLRGQRASRLRMVLSVLAICVALFITGLWLTAGFLSWGFLFGAANATDRDSGSPEQDDTSRERGWSGADSAKKLSLSSARKNASAPAASQRGRVHRSERV